MIGKRSPRRGREARHCPPRSRRQTLNRIEQPQRRILVLANRTCPCPALADEVARRASAAPTDVLVVAPALNARLRHWVSDVDAAVARAHERLALAIAALRARGVFARGEVGDADPMLAIAERLARPAPVGVEVVAQLALLLSDASSPVYAGGGHRRGLAEVLQSVWENVAPTDG
jgi:hypothetical protein